MEELRATGVSSGGPAPYDNRDKQAFANQLDRWLGQRPYHQRSSWRTAQRRAPLP